MRKIKENRENEPILKQDDAKPWLQVRYVIVFLCFTANTLNFMLRTNWSIAILPIAREFNWEIKKQQNILATFFISNSCSSLLGGWLVGKYGGFAVVLLAMISSFTMALLTPFAVNTSVTLLIINRLVDGFGQGMVMTGSVGIIRRWSILDERSTFISITTSGYSFGAILAMYLSSWLCTSTELGGWPTTFYSFGITTVIWCLLWCIFASSEPTDNRWISTFEKETLCQSTMKESEKDYTVPWKDIVKSAPVRALTISNFCADFGYLLLCLDLPTYFHSILEFDIETSGFLSVAPHAVFCITIIIGGLASDYIISHSMLSVTNTRKLIYALPLGLSSFLVVLTGYIENKVINVILLTIVLGFYGPMAGTVGANAIDLAPNHSSLIVGIAYTFSPGFISPMVTGAITKMENTIYQWRIIFCIVAGLHIIGIVSFVMFGSGEVQHWAKSSENNAESVPFTSLENKESDD